MAGRNGWMLLVVLCTAFFALNTALNLLNRWSLGIYGFKFPILLTASHAACSFLFMLPGVIFIPGQWARYKATLRRQWKGILLIGCCLAMNIAFNNLSLVHMGLSTNQIIKSSIPIVTAVFSAAVDGRMPHADEFGSLVFLSFGVSLAIAEARAAGNALGVTLCVLSVLAGATQLNASGRALSGKLDSVQLAFFTAPITSLALLPVFLIKEYSDFVVYFQTERFAACTIILAGSAIAAAYNVVHYAMVAVTDPVTTCVLGQIKVIAIMVLSATLLGEGKEFTPRMTAGCGFALVGFCVYSWAKLRRQRAAALAAAKSPFRTPRRTPRTNLIRAVHTLEHTPHRVSALMASPLRARTPASKMRAFRTPRSFAQVV